MIFAAVESTATYTPWQNFMFGRVRDIGLLTIVILCQKHKHSVIIYYHFIRGCSQMTSSPEGEGEVSQKMTNDDVMTGGGRAKDDKDISS